VRRAREAKIMCPGLNFRISLAIEPMAVHAFNCRRTYTRVCIHACAYALVQSQEVGRSKEGTHSSYVKQRRLSDEMPEVAMSAEPSKRVGLTGVWCVVCGVWCVVCGVWCVVCGVWCMVCGVWCVVFGVCGHVLLGTT
jgi:hypothetical protein